MARNDVFLNINALSPADAVVTGQQDMTAATVPELVLGDTPTFNFYFTDNTNVWPSWAGNAAYTVTWALSDAVSGDFSPAATTGNATPITGGWSVVLPLNAYDLVGLLNTKRVSQPYPVTNLWQQIRVADPSGNEITRAMFWTPIRYRAISDTQNTESASPTGGREVTVDNVNVLTTPTAAQFYAANPVPTSALGSAANGELLIGNGTGFTKSTLTAGTGITVTNGSGSITIDASGAQETLTATVKNAESVAITKGQVVYLFGATGNMPSVKLAYNTSDATSAKTFGVVSDTSIAANGTGTVTCVGVVDGLNLGAYNDGDTLYLGATPGSVTATKPYAPNHLVYVGIVERANAGNGELYVKVQNGYELDEIHDVQINAPRQSGQTLIYDNTTSLWKNARITAGSNIAVTNGDGSISIGFSGTLPVANGGTGVTTSTGSGSVVLSTSPTLTTPILGTPQSGTLSSCTGLPISTGVSGLGTNVATFLATPSSANLASAVTDETGTGALVFANTPTLVTPNIGAATGTSVNLSGAGTFGGNLTVSGTASFASSLTASGNGTFGGNSLAGNRTLIVSNTATADGSWASMAVDTSASGLKLAHLSSGWSSTFLTGGPTTTQAVIYTSSSAPIVFGVNSTYVGKAESTGWTLAGNLTVSGTGLSSFAGSLGIGTTSPTRPLDVRGSLGMQVNEDNAGTKVISIRSDFASAGPAINVTTNDPLLFLTNNSERARITSGGNVGIGTTTPDPTSLGGRALTLSGDFTRARLQLRNTDSSSVGSVAGTLQWMAGSTSLATVDVASETAANTAYLAFSTSASGTIAEAMRISATNRNLLIGTTTDLSRLTVVKDAAGSDIGAGEGQVMIAGATNTNKRLAIGFNTTSDYGWLQAGIAGTAYKPLVLNNNGGNVLIGTTTDGGQKLQVNGTANVSGQLGATKAVNGAAPSTSLSDYALYLGSAQSNTYVNSICWSEGTNPNSAIVGVDAGSGGAHGIAFYTGNNTSIAQSLYLDNSQNATFAGNIKTAAPSGGTAATWRLGTVASVSPTSPNRTIEVEIGGTTYYIHAKTTNN